MADAAQFEKVRSIVTSDESRRVVVVSAAGKRYKDDHKVTDLLYLCHAHLQYGVSCDGIYDMIRSRYVAIRDALGLKTPLEAEFAALREKMDKGISADELVSRGEYFAAELMADYLGYGFLDTDLVIQQREGLLLQDILDQFGVKHFLQVEEEAIRTVDCRRTVIAPGGSAVCREGTMAHLKELGPVVYLRVPMEELTSRIQNLATRGIAMEPGQTLADVLAQRAPLYERYADLTVDCLPGQTLAQTTQMVLALLNGRR